MGSLHSKHSAPHPTPEPIALLKTTAGVIVRIPDHASGKSTFHHNPRFIQPATLSDALIDDGAVGQLSSSHADQQVLVARAGAKNGALKSKVVYVKKPPRQQQSNES